MMKYPKEYLNEIRLRLKVSQVVGKYVNLKKRGKEFIGLSPFKMKKHLHLQLMMKKDFIIVLALESMEIFLIF